MRHTVIYALKIVFVILRIDNADMDGMRIYLFVHFALPTTM